jgi:hypothetical protein
MPFYGELRAKLSPQIEAARGSHAVAGYPLRDPSHGQSGPIDAPSMPLRSPEPSPQPQPEPQPAACVDDDDVAGRTGCDLRATVRTKVERLLDAPSITQFNRIDAWLDSGADPERDIYPTIAAGLNKLGKPPASLKYFDGAIADAIAARKAPLPPGRARGATREIPDSGAYVAPVRNPAAEAFRLDSYVEIIAAGRNPGLGCSSQDVRRLLKAGRVTVEQCLRAGCSP